MNVAARFMPPLLVVALFAIPAVALAPREAPAPPHTIAPAERRSCTLRPRPSNVERELEGCLIEWNEREPGDADLLVRLRVNDGVASAETEAGPESPMLRLCVAEAIARVPAPKGGYTEADVFVRWTDGRVKMTAAATERRLQPIRDVEWARAEIERSDRELARLRREIERLRARGH